LLLPHRFLRAAVACGLPDYAGPSGEKYTLPEDIPEGHTTLQSPMVPDTDGTTIHDWLFDAAADKWVLWESRLDNSPIDKARCPSNTVSPGPLPSV